MMERMGQIMGEIATAAAGWRSIGLAALVAVFVVAGCGDPGVRIESQVVTTACASCIFAMEGVENCPFAVEIDGEPYVVQGSVPQDHLSHAPDGICNMPRLARVEGTIRDGKFIAASFELLPPEDVPEEPRFTEEDIH